MMPSSSFDLGSNGYCIIVSVIIYLSCYSIALVGASIHEYQNETFIHRSNSFFFHGGSEGLYASRVTSGNVTQASEDKSLNGKSFIR